MHATRSSGFMRRLDSRLTLRAFALCSPANCERARPADNAREGAANAPSKPVTAKVLGLVRWPDRQPYPSPCWSIQSCRVYFQSARVRSIHIWPGLYYNAPDALRAGESPVP